MPADGGAAEEALPQRDNSRRRQRHQQQPAEGAEAEGEAGSAACGRPSKLQVAAAGTPPAHGEPEATASAATGGGAYCSASSREDGGEEQGDVAGPGPGSGQGVQPAPAAVLPAEGTGELLPAYRSAAVRDYKFEYLDHTADVQLHAWGTDLREAFEQCGLAMFNYMSSLEHVAERESRLYRAEGHDLQSLLFAFLDELLFVFSTELFLCCRLAIRSFDREAFVIEVEGWGDTFHRDTHEVGTEIKAITYSAMSIREGEGDAEVFVIVDI